MGKKSSVKKSVKKVMPSTVAPVAVTATTESQLSYDEMLSELEAIVSDADIRLTEEETRL